MVRYILVLPKVVVDFLAYSYQKWWLFIIFNYHFW